MVMIIETWNVVTYRQSTAVSLLGNVELCWSCQSDKIVSLREVTLVRFNLAWIPESEGFHPQ